MDQREKLEKELKFLNASFESKVISEEEYGESKKRIEDKMKDLEEQQEEEKEISIQEIIDEKQIKLSSKNENDEELDNEEKDVDEDDLDDKEESFEKEKEFDEEDNFDKKDKKPFKINKRIIVWVALLLIILLINFCIKNAGDSEPIEVTVPTGPVCISDEDCKQDGKIGICQDSGEENAKCVFKDDAQVKLTVVNDPNCVSCKTAAMIKGLQDIFPGVIVEEINFDSEEGKVLIKEYGLNSLPSYLFDKSLLDTQNYDSFKRAVYNVGDKYLMKNSASGAAYYFDRKEVIGSLKTFVLSGSKNEVEANVEEVLALFGNKLNFDIVEVDSLEKEKLKDELGITAFPIFLVNNQLLFRGIQSPDSIKEKFCELNNLDECNKDLSKAVFN